MGQILVRQLDDATIARLKARARERKTSVEALAREAIREAAKLTVEEKQAIVRDLWAWSDGLESRLEDARAILKGEQGERALRAYRLYLAGCAAGFENGWIALHQILCQHTPSGRRDELDLPADLAYPWRRGYMYDNT